MNDSFRIAQTTPFLDVLSSGLECRKGDEAFKSGAGSFGNSEMLKPSYKNLQNIQEYFIHFVLQELFAFQ
jgi:hypothetical protein